MPPAVTKRSAPLLSSSTVIFPRSFRSRSNRKAPGKENGRPVYPVAAMSQISRAIAWLAAVSWPTTKTLRAKWKSSSLHSCERGHAQPRSSGAGSGSQRLQRTEQGRQQLRHRRMDMHGTLDDGVGRLHIHHVEQGMDDLVAAGSQDACPENLLAVGVDQNLHEAVGLTLLDRSSNFRHQPLGGEHAAARAQRLGLGHAGAAERRIDEQSIGRDAVPDAAPTLVEQVRRDDLEIIVGG